MLQAGMCSWPTGNHQVLINNAFSLSLKWNSRNFLSQVSLLQGFLFSSFPVHQCCLFQASAYFPEPSPQPQCWLLHPLEFWTTEDLPIPFKLYSWSITKFYHHFPFSFPWIFLLLSILQQCILKTFLLCLGSPIQVSILSILVGNHFINQFSLNTTPVFHSLICSQTCQWAVC